MPFGSVTLKPGVDVESTATLSRASYSTSQFGRFRAGLFEKLGGWSKFFAFALSGVPRALQAWQDFNAVDWLAIGTSGTGTTLDVISNNALYNITPQTKITDPSPMFATTASSATVSVTDANVSNVTVNDTLEFNTPIAIGGIVLSGSYAIQTILSATQYTITAASPAVTTRANATITAITAANPGVVTTSGAHGFTTGDLIYFSGVVGMTQVNNRLFAITSTGANTFTIVDTSAYTAYSSGGVASPGAVPFFTTTSGSASVTVTLQDHGLSAGSTIALPISTTLQKSIVTITNASPAVVTWFTGTHGMTGNEPIVFTTTGTLPTGLTAGTTYYVLAAGITTTTFRVSATVGGAAINTTGAGSGIHTGTVGSLAVSGTYTVLSVTDADHFIISAANSAIANSVDPMNGGNAELVYYIGLGPVSATGTSYSFSTYSSGPYSGAGAGGSSAQTGTAITATDWTLDNWGETLLSCPANGGLYQWTPNTGFQNAQLVTSAPIHNGGIFVATPYQILIAWGSTVQKTIGIARDPLTWNASDILDYSYWTIGGINPSGNASQAYTNRIPTGSAIKAGMATPNQILLWTDLDLWSLSYLGPPLIWGQNKIGSNCGAVSRHCVAQMSGVVYWRGTNNFFALAGGSPVVIPCSVWDVVFQDTDAAAIDKCWTQTVTSFNEMWHFWASASGGTGQCDSYVKVNILDGSWDYGLLPRSIGIDQSVFGNPIMATPTGVIYTHESTYNADGQPLMPSMTSGYFYIAEGQDFVVVDQVLPDMKWGTFSGAQNAVVQITFSVIDNEGDTPRMYGPYNMTSTTNIIDVRFRGRQMAVTVSSSDTDSFWRLGHIRYRYALSGRR